MIDEGLLIDFPLSAPEDTYVTYTYTGHQWFEVVILCWREHIAKHVIDANRADIASRQRLIVAVNTPRRRW